jgi:hypothetical protein
MANAPFAQKNEKSQESRRRPLKTCSPDSPLLSVPPNADASAVSGGLWGLGLRRSGARRSRVPNHIHAREKAEGANYSGNDSNPT